MIKITDCWKIIIVFLLISILILPGCLGGNKDKNDQEGDHMGNQTQNEVCGNDIAENEETCSNCPADVKCKSNEKCVS